MSSILLLVTVVSEKCLKQTETEETIGFFVPFLSLVKFQLGTPILPLGYAYAPIKESKKGIANFPRGFWRFPTKFQLFKKKVLSSSRGHGNFRGLEASRPRPRT